MPSQYDIHAAQEQEAQRTSQELAQLLEEFLTPFLLVLDTLFTGRYEAKVALEAHGAYEKGALSWTQPRKL